MICSVSHVKKRLQLCRWEGVMCISYLLTVYYFCSLFSFPSCRSPAQGYSDQVILQAGILLANEPRWLSWWDQGWQQQFLWVPWRCLMGFERCLERSYELSPGHSGVFYASTLDLLQNPFICRWMHKQNHWPWVSAVVNLQASSLISKSFVVICLRICQQQKDQTIFCSRRESGWGNSGLDWGKGTRSSTAPVELQARRASSFLCSVLKLFSSVFFR